MDEPGFESGDRTAILLTKVQTEFLKTLQLTVSLSFLF